MVYQASHRAYNRSLSKVLKVVAECGVSVREVSMFREANAPVYFVKVIITGTSAPPPPTLVVASFCAVLYAALRCVEPRVPLVCV